MFYSREAEDMGYNNKEFVRMEMKNWCKLRKQGKIEMLEENNLDCKINGRQYYVLVIQCPNECVGIDPTGLGWDDGCCFVDGYIYYFQKKVNRDMVYKYVMGIKNPQPEEVLPTTIVSGIVCRACGLVLEPHTSAEHLDTSHPIHSCLLGHKKNLVSGIVCSPCGLVLELGVPRIVEE
tara:strand:- start:369 stop:902 length:534 start_codon:yes stop_codon:yes gene_type:complete